MTRPRKPRDYALISRELVRALRGRRSQLGLSRRLGYSTNVLYTWEAGQAWPAASRFFQAANCVGVRAETVVKKFFRVVPPELKGSTLATPKGIQRFLEVLLGHTRVTTLARASGISRFSLSRWLGGTSQPRLPELLQYIEATSLRLLDFVDALVDPSCIAALAGEWSTLQAARAVGYEQPFSHAVLRALETRAYRRRRSGCDEPTVLAGLLGVDAALVRECLAALAAAGQIRRRRGRWEPETASMVDFRREPQASQHLKAFWASVAQQRSTERRPGLFAYNVFAVSRADLARIEVLQRDTLRQMRTIIAESEPSEVVALANFQLFDLSATPKG